MKIVIKHRLSFDFLGADYADAYMIFKKVPVGDLENIRKKMTKSGNETIPHFLLPYLKEYFISGSFPEGEVDAESLDSFDNDTVYEVWKQISGQDYKAALEASMALGQEVPVGIDPKSETP